MTDDPLLRSLEATTKRLQEVSGLLRLHWRDHADISVAYHAANNALATHRQAVLLRRKELEDK